MQKRDDNTVPIIATHDTVKVNDKNPKLIDVAGKEYNLTDDAFKSLCEKLKVPYSYAKRSPLISSDLNYWLGRKGQDAFLALSDQNDNVRAFMDSSHTYVPSVEIVRAVVNIFSSHDWEVRGSSISGPVVKVDITSGKQGGAALGDITDAGISIVHSDSWSVGTRFDSYLLRLACLNGQVAPVHGRKFRVSGQTVEQIINQVGEFAELAFSQLDDMLAGYERLREKNVENIPNILTRIVKENGLPSKVLKALLEASMAPAFLATVPNSRVVNMLDVLNILTWVGTHNQELSENHRKRLQLIAGHLSITGHHRCDGCGALYGLDA